MSVQPKVTNLQVCQAASITKLGLQFTLDILVSISGQPEKVCFRAMERAADNGLIEYGVSLRSAWITDKGKDLLTANHPPSPPGPPR